MNNTTAAAPESAGAAVPSPTEAAPKIKVRVVQQAVLEGGKYFLKGQVLEVTEDRAKRLGKFVEPVTVEPPATIPPTAPEPTVTLQVTEEEAAELHKLAKEQGAQP